VEEHAAKRNRPLIASVGFAGPKARHRPASAICGLDRGAPRVFSRQWRVRISAGATSYKPKPFEPEELIRFLRSAIGSASPVETGGSKGPTEQRLR